MDKVSNLLDREASTNSQKKSKQIRGNENNCRIGRREEKNANNLVRRLKKSELFCDDKGKDLPKLCGSFLCLGSAGPLNMLRISIEA
jgi:hypothetical protein